MLKNCKSCNIEFTGRKEKLYCSKECGLDYRCGVLTEIACLGCGKKVSCRARKLRKFCSRSCSVRYNNKVSPKRIKQQRYCTVCESVIASDTSNKKYCSWSCRYPKKEDTNCLNCQKSLPNGRKFCGAKCQNEKKHRHKIKMWISGEISGNVGKATVTLSKAVRKYLLEQANNSCSVCGYSKKHKITGNYILSVDHIDGDHLNSRPENLRVLCPNCHAETENYGSLNTGNGRRYERMKYRKESQ